MGRNRLYDDLYTLAISRADEDERILHYVGRLDETSLSETLVYATTSGKQFQQKQSAILAHLFNHQTHHRGQAHTIFSILTGRHPPPLDLLAMQRGAVAPDLRSLAQRQSI